MKLLDLFPYIEKELIDSRKFYDAMSFMEGQNGSQFRDAFVWFISKSLDRDSPEAQTMKQILNHLQPQIHSKDGLDNIFRESIKNDCKEMYKDLTDFQEKSRLERLIKACESSLEISLNGVHFELGTFDERNAINMSDYDMVRALQTMKVRMPYEKMSIGINLNEENKATPLILTAETIGDYVLLVPWFQRDGGEWFLFPPSAIVLNLTRNMHDILNEYEHPKALETFFDNSMTGTLEGSPNGIYKDGSGNNAVSDDGEDISNSFSVYLTSDLYPEADWEKESKEEKIHRLSMENSMMHCTDMVTTDYLLRFLFLLNTRGVSTKTVNPPLKVNKKRERNGKRLIPAYKILSFDLPKYKSGTTLSSTDEKKWHPRLHTCHGHTKFYGSEKPLFGHYIGPVWCPQHLRGRRTEGIILKDYSLKQ